MIRDVVFEGFDKRVRITTAGRILKRIGLSPQRLLLRAAKQNPEEVEAWKNTEYPRIKEMACQEDAEIFFEDEAGISHHLPKRKGMVAERRRLSKRPKPGFD